MKKSILIFVLFLVSTALFYSEEINEEYYFKKINEATFISEKNVFALKLGLMKTQKAKGLLLNLFNDVSSWNRAGVIDGLIALGDPEADGIMVEKFLSDAMIANDLSAAMKKNFGRFCKILVDKFYSTSLVDENEKILSFFGESNSAGGEAFLKKIVSDNNSTYRKTAFKSLVLNYKENNYEFAKNYSADRELREFALPFLVETGSKNDLPLFLKIIENNEEGKYLAVSYEAVGKWGDMELISKVYLDALKNKDDNAVQAALYIFSDVRSNDIKEELERLVKQAKYQNIRITAGINLLKYNSKDVIPYAVSVLKEKYESRDTFSGADILASLFSIGLSTLLDKYEKSRSRDNFEARMNEIEKSLSSIAGAGSIHGYDAWLSWAVCKGYTVDGINIIQYLFSGSRDKSRKAVQSSFLLLGYKTEKDFFKDHPDFRNYSENDLLLSLARLLMDKGFFIEEKY